MFPFPPNANACQCPGVCGKATVDYRCGYFGGLRQRDTTKREHTALIREQYGYREFSDPPWAFRLSRLLYTRAWISNERPSLMFDFATAWLNQNKVLLPGATTLSRLISEIRERAVNRLWRRLAALPTTEQKAKLETLLKVQKARVHRLLIVIRKAR